MRLSLLQQLTRGTHHSMCACSTRDLLRSSWQRYHERPSQCRLADCTPAGQQLERQQQQRALQYHCSKKHDEQHDLQVISTINLA